MRGLEITFTDRLMRGANWVTPGGAVFHFDHLQTFNLEENTVTLRADYEAVVPMDDEVVIFQSEAPNATKMFVHKSKIVSIKDLAKNKVLYPQT